MTKKNVRTADRHLHKVDSLEEEKIRQLKASDGFSGEFSVRAFAVLARAINEIHITTNTQATRKTAADLKHLIAQLDRLMAIKNRAGELRDEIQKGKLARLDKGW